MNGFWKGLCALFATVPMLDIPAGLGFTDAKADISDMEEAASWGTSYP